MIFHSEKYGPLEFDQATVDRYGQDVIFGHVQYLDNQYPKHANDPHALILAAIAGNYGWYVKDESEAKANVNRERARAYLHEQHRIEEEVKKKRNTPEYRKAAQGFFDLRKKLQQQGVCT